jgi:serine/threonine-protein kinase HipA
VILDVHFNAERIGSLSSRSDGGYRFAYSSETVERLGAGTTLLSTSLPVRRKPFSPERSRAFVEGLLPEGRLRDRVAAGLGLDPADSFGLLAELGRDCPGSVVFLPMGTPFVSGAGRTLCLEAKEVEDLTAVSPRRLRDSATGGRLRFVLAGIRHKLALAREGSRGPWALPAADWPSTHILRSESGDFPDQVPNEAFCMTIARQIGLPVAPFRLEWFDGRPCLTVERSDREVVGREVRRVHQETLCQALGVPPSDDALASARMAPGFAECCGLLRAVGRPGDTRVIVTAALCNYILGNGDAHARNFALRLDGGRSRLTPLRGIASTVVYDAPSHAGLVLNEAYDERAFLPELAAASEQCDISFDIFRTIAAVTASSIDSSIEPVLDLARSQGWHAPVIDDIGAIAHERALGLIAEVES